MITDPAKLRRPDLFNRVRVNLDTMVALEDSIQVPYDIDAACNRCGDRSSQPSYVNLTRLVAYKTEDGKLVIEPWCKTCCEEEEVTALSHSEVPL